MTIPSRTVTSARARVRAATVAWELDDRDLRGPVIWSAPSRARGGSQARLERHALEERGIWGFEYCVAHNNSVNGIFVWQNSDRRHVIDRFVAFHNGQAGIEHGAYLNSYVYRNVELVGNSLAGVLLHAESHDQGSLRFENVTVDGRGITNFGFLGAESTLDGAPAIECGPSITGVTESDLSLDYSGDSIEDRFDVRDSC